eukprot:983990_1
MLQGRLNTAISLWIVLHCVLSVDGDPYEVSVTDAPTSARDIILYCLLLGVAIVVIVGGSVFCIWKKNIAPQKAQQKRNAPKNAVADREGIKKFTDCHLPEGIRPGSECVSIEMDSLPQDAQEAKA